MASFNPAMISGGATKQIMTIDIVNTMNIIMSWIITHKTTMISDTLKKRMTKDRPMTSITLRIPVDVVDSMKSIAPCKGFSGYQALLKAFYNQLQRYANL
jgi:hypothetical protein